MPAKKTPMKKTVVTPKKAVKAAPAKPAQKAVAKPAAKKPAPTAKKASKPAAKLEKPAKRPVVKPAAKAVPAKKIVPVAKPAKPQVKPVAVKPMPKPAPKPEPKPVAKAKPVEPKPQPKPQKPTHTTAATASVIPESPLTFPRPKKFQVVAKSKHKLDGIGLVCGIQKYVMDLDLQNPVYVKIMTSPHAHARIKKIDTAEAFKIPGVVAIYTWKDVPRIPHTTAGQGFPEPSPYDTFILDNKVRFVGDRVAIIAADTPEAAQEACRRIKVEYDILPAVFDPEKARDPGAPVIHDEPEAYMPIPTFFDPKHNHCAHMEARVGDVEKGYKDADYVLERKYYPHYAQHCPIEPHCCIGYLDENDRLVLRTSTQVPFHARRITAQALDIPLKKIRVIKPRIGGGFGTKQEVLLEDVVALVTLRTRRPAILELTRPEEFVSSRTRHPMVVTIKAGVKKNGEITALSMKVISNTGAYGSHALTVMCNCGSKVLPLYKAKNVEFIGDTVYTNLPVGGAYRGYGATQAAYGVEALMDECAKAIGMDALEFRKRNHIREGDSSPIFKALGEGREGVDMAIKSCGLPECIEWGAKEIDWKNKRNRPGKGLKRRGIGMAILMQGSSIPEIDMGAVSIKMNDDGSFNMLLGATDLGTGSDTILAQIAAETLGCRHDQLLVYSSDTDMTPFDVGAYASSTTYLSGGAVINTANKVREQILAVASIMPKMQGATDLEAEDGWVYSKSDTDLKVSFAEIATFSLYEKRQFQIAAVGSHISHASPPPFSAHFAEVEVDTETGEVKLVKYAASVDCGTPINPQLAEGQLQGAVVNGISFALTEEYIFDSQGRMLNPNFRYYKIYTANDMPDLKTHLAITYEPTGPYGAKSVSEIGINGPLPALANAIYDAVGVRLVKPPFTAEKILAGIKELKKNGQWK